MSEKGARRIGREGRKLQAAKSGAWPEQLAGRAWGRKVEAVGPWMDAQKGKHTPVSVD